MMKIPENNQYVLFGGVLMLANKMQLVGDKKVRAFNKTVVFNAESA